MRLKKQNKLDKIDLIILNALQEDGRRSNVEISQIAGISPPPCLRRIKSLEEQGYINSYHAAINPEALGYHVNVLAHVCLKSHAEQDLRKFEQQVNLWPEVRECYMQAGDVDYILKIIAKDWDDYQRFLTQELTQTENVAQVKSNLIMKQIKKEIGVPLLDSAPYDDTTPMNLVDSTPTSEPSIQQIPMVSDSLIYRDV